MQSCTRANSLERQLLTIREQHKCEEKSVEQLRAQYEETKEALSEALHVCQALATQLARSQLSNINNLA